MVDGGAVGGRCRVRSVKKPFDVVPGCPVHEKDCPQILNFEILARHIKSMINDIIHISHNAT